PRKDDESAGVLLPAYLLKRQGLTPYVRQSRQDHYRSLCAHASRGRDASRGTVRATGSPASTVRPTAFVRSVTTSTEVSQWQHIVGTYGGGASPCSVQRPPSRRPAGRESRPNAIRRRPRGPARGSCCTDCAGAWHRATSNAASCRPRACAC